MTNIIKIKAIKMIENINENLGYLSTKVLKTSEEYNIIGELIQKCHILGKKFQYIMEISEKYKDSILSPKEIPIIISNSDFMNEYFISNSETKICKPMIKIFMEFFQKEILGILDKKIEKLKVKSEHQIINLQKFQNFRYFVNFN